MTNSFGVDRSANVMPEVIPDVPRRRGKGLVIGLIATLLVVALGIGGTVWYLHRADVQRREAAPAAYARFATSMSNGSFSPEFVASGSQSVASDDIKELVKKYGHTVTVKELTVNGKKSTATFKHVWSKLPGEKPLEYETPAEMVWEDGEWKAIWSKGSAIPTQAENTKLVFEEVIVEKGDVTGDGGKPLTVDGLQGASTLWDKHREALASSPLVKITVQRPDKSVETELGTFGEASGRTLALSVNETMQRGVQSMLAEHGGVMSIVAIRPSDGHVLAIGSGGDGYGHATKGRYAPGSTFKIVSSLALMRSKGWTAESTVNCPSEYTLNGRTISNHSHYPPSAVGSVPFKTAVANSCNTLFAMSAPDVSDDALQGAARSLGMTLDPSLGLPAVMGSIPEGASGLDAAYDMIGHGKVVATPLAMATVMASVAAGHPVRPVYQLDKAPPPAKDTLTDGETAALRSLTRAVVTSGTGRLLAGLPGAPVYAKSGTADYSGANGSGTHAWMVAAKGDLAVAVFVKDGESGSATAGPIVKRFLEKYAGQ